jgi:EpsI family protein
MKVPFVTHACRLMTVRALPMKPLRLSLVLSLLMAAVALAATAMHHALTASSKPSAPKFVLGKMVPASFGAWRLVEAGTAQVVNPQAQQLLDTLYSQTLTRTYASADGYLIMLSIAYGDEQRVGLNAHMPEVCYPAQGFRLIEQSVAAIATAYGPIKVKRIETQMGTRAEPVTYWLVYGDQILDGSSRLGTKVRFALGGHVPDGLLFRVSSIDGQRDRAFRMQDQFVAALLTAVGPSGRAHLVGMPQR